MQRPGWRAPRAREASKYRALFYASVLQRHDQIIDFVGPELTVEFIKNGISAHRHLNIAIKRVGLVALAPAQHRNRQLVEHQANALLGGEQLFGDFAHLPKELGILAALGFLKTVGVNLIEVLRELGAKLLANLGKFGSLMAHMSAEIGRPSPRLPVARGGANCARLAKRGPGMQVVQRVAVARAKTRGGDARRLKLAELLQRERLQKVALRGD